MELFTLTSKFLPKDAVRDFTSAIWTERYFTTGDVTIVVPSTPEWIELLAPGEFLGLRGTMEIMEIKSHSIEDGLLKVTGESILGFLNDRVAWFPNPEYDGSDPNVALQSALTSDVMTAGELISDAVYRTVIDADAFLGDFAAINLDWAADDIPGLVIGPTDHNGTPQRFSISTGPLYDAIKNLASEQGVGLKMYLFSASYDSGYVLKFSTYRGKNRTSDNPNPDMVVRLTPKMDALTDVKEVSSNSQYKNVVYVKYKEPTAGQIVSTHYIPGLATPSGFDRRVMMVEAEELYFNPALPDYAAKVAAYRARVASNTFANHIYIHAVDGNVSSKIPYIYGVHYGLGDVIELQGYTEEFTKARITEYIRSQDQYGEQEYPTLAVLDPTYIGTIPDLEPDEDFPEWVNDTAFDLDVDDDVWVDDEHTRKRRRRRRRSEGEDPNPEPEPEFNPVADFTWELI